MRRKELRPITCHRIEITSCSWHVVCSPDFLFSFRRLPFRTMHRVGPKGRFSEDASGATERNPDRLSPVSLPGSRHIRMRRGGRLPPQPLRRVRARAGPVRPSRRQVHSDAVRVAPAQPGPQRHMVPLRHLGISPPPLARPSDQQASRRRGWLVCVGPGHTGRHGRTQRDTDQRTRTRAPVTGCPCPSLFVHVRRCLKFPTSPPRPSG